MQPTRRTFLRIAVSAGVLAATAPHASAGDPAGETVSVLLAIPGMT